MSPLVPFNSTSSTAWPTAPGSSSPRTISFSPTSSSTSDTTSKPSSLPLSSHSILSLDPLSTSYSTTSPIVIPFVHPIPSVTATPSYAPTRFPDPVTTLISTPIATYATVASVITSTQEASITTFSSSSVESGKSVTQTSVILIPALSPNTGSGNVSHSLNIGAVTAVSVTAATSMAVWAFLAYRRRKNKQKLESDSITAAMTAAGIIRAPPLLADEDDDDVLSMFQWPHSVFEDGAPVTSGVGLDLSGPFNRYHNYVEPPLVLGSTSWRPPAPNASQMAQSPSMTTPPACRVYRERIHTPPPSQGRESLSHSSHEPLMWTSGSSLQSYSPPLYPLLRGSFQRQDVSTLRTSSEESYAPPKPPPHILTSFAPLQPAYMSVQLGSAKRESPISDSAQYDDEEEHASSPLLDSRLGERLREGGESKGSMGLHDNEDYSARPRLEIRNWTGSQRTLGSENSKNSSRFPSEDSIWVTS